MRNDWERGAGVREGGRHREGGAETETYREIETDRQRHRERRRYSHGETERKRWTILRKRRRTSAWQRETIEGGNALKIFPKTR